MTGQLQSHWDKVYRSVQTEELGWHEDVPAMSLNLLQRCNLNHDDLIVDVGAGSSTLIDHLIQCGHEAIVAVDLSQAALESLQSRLGEEAASKVRWMVDDITQPEHITRLSGVAVWHDRAVLHFLQQEEKQQAYLSTLKSVLKPDGFVIIAAFSLEGAGFCSGLSVHRYDAASLTAFLGDGFTLLGSFDYTYYQPSGNPRPFIYTLFQR